jgi:hypothetical protein
MGGTSKSTQQSQQQSQLTPWAPAASGLTDIFGRLAPSIDTLAGTPLTNQAFGALAANAQAPNPYAVPVQGATLAELAGAPNYAHATNLLDRGYGATAAALSPYTSGSALDPASNPALAQELGLVNTDVMNAVNPMFAAAGRLGSPANYQAVARGIAQGSAPILANAASNQINAAGALTGAGTSTAAGLGNLDAGNAGILAQGIANAPAAYAAQSFGPQALLTTALAQQQLPISNAGLLSSIYGQSAAQFGTQSGSSSSTGTQTMSPMQQILMGTQAFDNLLSPFRTRTGWSFPG